MAYHINETLGDIEYEVVNGNELVLKVRGGIGGGGTSIYIIKEDDATEPSDTNVFSAARTILEIQKRASRDSAWELVEQEDGTKYLLTEYPVATKQGITAYMRNELDLPGIMDGIVCDNVTIKVNENGQLEVIGGTGGGVSNWEDLQGKPEWITDTAPNNNIFPNTANYWVTDNKKISNWDSAASKSHEHANKATLDKIYEKDGVIYWDGSLAVTGGITAYALGSVEVSTIMDGVVVDGTTIKKENGKLVVIGGSGSSFDKTAMWAALSAATSEQINKSHLTDALSGYALQASLDEVSTKLNDFLEGSDTDTIINKWKELEVFLSGMQETDNLAEILSNKADTTYVNSELSKYVTLATEQTIDGLKHFTNGLTIGATKHKIYEKDGNILIEGNVLVTGGITAYSDGSSSGGSGGGGIDVDVLWEILGGTGTQQINKTHLTTALSGYATESWVTSKNYAVKATTLSGYGITDAYTKTQANSTFVNVAGDTMTGNLTIQGITIGSSNEINSTDGLFLAYQNTPQGVNICHNNSPLTYGSGNHTIWHAGNDGHGSGLDADLLDGKHATDFATSGHTHTYLPYQDTRNENYNPYDNNFNERGLSATHLKTNTADGLNDGGTYHASIYLYPWGDPSGGAAHNLAFTDNGNMWLRSGTSSWNSWKKLAFTTDNVASATKLQTARYIFGQSFNGEQDVNGTVKCSSVMSTNIRIECDNNGVFGSRGGEINSYNAPLQLQYNTSQQLHLCCGGGSVGIGTTSPAYKLDVNGDIIVSSWIRTRGQTGWYSETYGGGWYMTDYTYVRSYNSKKVYSGGGYLAPYGGSMWITMATRSDIIDGDQNQSTNGAHALYRVKTSGGHAVVFGGLDNNVGFYGFYKSRIDTNENGTDWSTTWDATNGTITHRGNFLATGGITCYASDQRAKTVIEQISLSLKQIANAPTIRFKWNNWKIKDDGKTHIGGIAQYMQKLLPETVLEADGALNMDYSTTAYIFSVQTARHLQTYETRTDKELRKLKKRVLYLEKQLKKLGYEETDFVAD